MFKQLAMNTARRLKASCIDLSYPEQDYIFYRSRSRYLSLSFMELPFLLQTTTKSVHLYLDNRMRMLEERSSAFPNYLTETPYFKLRIARDRVVEDALLALEITCTESPGDLKKQLYVEFEGEQGIDEGGLSKEFFQMIVERLFNPDYGMFTYDQTMKSYWFNSAPVEDMDREYCLIGTVLGLAIYNHVILDAQFPTVLYRKLVGKLGTFEDLKEAQPDLARGLQAMLEFDGTDEEFEEIFSMSFVITYKDMFGEAIVQELLENGSRISVTKWNRKQFVDYYADFLLNKSVKKQFSAFRRGFQMVVDESPLTFLFRPDELELLVRGSQEYDFLELERVTTYEGDYSASSPVIQNFWSVLHEMDREQQKQLLQFATGSDRIPLGGMAKMRFVIAKQGPDSDRYFKVHLDSFVSRVLL
ncbi:unnamed protein product [Protopolystoma xenopodis]|uniref:HECT-type E3 ubiquitin transferase n=1 Tax=Protopolystoma xenopodis TaxID=117903 RepID=A0A448XFW4_9PLAT|nr:unnamed protein product [Protopolystoma xenopodis]